MILIVEDTEHIRKLVKAILKNENIDVEEAVTGEEAINKIQQGNKYELILMDVMLPKIDGINTTKKIREITETPIIFLTALSDERSQIIAYEAGADGYITKPFSKEILKSIVIRYVFKSGIVKKYGNLEINKKSGKVLINKEEINLTIKERDILFYLEENKGIVKTREQIILGVWGYDFTGTDRTVDKHLTRLREKLGNCSKYIKTVKAIGYKFEE
ncbi:response regulator transcription factor [uncultured Fusobacterium sp.]|uniref:response regulator transcription factor n=1 Tax=uncultured Fusobacterium sp. TaxID=159267 RepID=UPI0025918001|nr:response regulator transcription factor [uncultured Fusobacterium sp.]